MRKVFLQIAGITLLAISGVFVLGILRPEAVSPVWGTNEIANEVKDPNTGEISEEVVLPAKTIWDLFDLLLVPMVIAIGGYLFNQAQQSQSQKLSLDREQEQTLQNYLDRMSDLLVEKKLNTTKNKVIKNLARSHTLTALRSLNNPYLDINGRGRNRRKGTLARFIYEMNLILGDQPIINLSKANLEYSYMHKGEFPDVNFSDGYLKQADLRRANLQSARLEKADLPGARLNEANLKDADLRNANLKDANLERANLQGAKLDGAILTGAHLKDAIMPDGTLHD